MEEPEGRLLRFKTPQRHVVSRADGIDEEELRKFAYDCAAMDSPPPAMVGTLYGMATQYLKQDDEDTCGWFCKAVAESLMNKPSLQGTIDELILASIEARAFHDVSCGIAFLLHTAEGSELSHYALERLVKTAVTYIPDDEETMEYAVLAATTILGTSKEDFGLEREQALQRKRFEGYPKRKR